MTESLTDFVIRSHDAGIHTVARFISRQVAASWQKVLEENFAHLPPSGALIDGTLYILYLKLLFEPIHAALERAGFAADPPLPGSFFNSREWGPDQERQRWLWTRLSSPRGELLGTEEESAGMGLSVSR